MIVVGIVLVACQREKAKEQPKETVADTPPPKPPPDRPDPPTPAPAPTPGPPDTPTPGVTAEYKAAITNLCNVVEAAKADPAWVEGDKSGSLKLITKYVAKAKQSVTDPTAKRDIAALDNMPDVNRFVPILDSLADRVGIKACGFTTYLKEALARKAAQQAPAPTTP